MPEVFSSPQWPEIVGRIVILWGRIEFEMVSTLSIDRQRTVGSIPINFASRLKQWNHTVSKLGDSAPYSLPKLSGSLARLRAIRDNVVHGSLVICTDKAKYVLQSPNKSTRQLAFVQRLRATKLAHRKHIVEAKRHGAFDEGFTQAIEYDVGEIELMLAKELPASLERVGRTGVAFRRWHSERFWEQIQAMR
jgi:hypothetical protein